MSHIEVESILPVRIGLSLLTSLPDVTVCTCSTAFYLKLSTSTPQPTSESHCARMFDFVHILLCHSTRRPCRDSLRLSKLECLQQVERAKTVHTKHEHLLADASINPEPLLLVSALGSPPRHTRTHTVGPQASYA
jgi:hypothetical protein